MLQKCEARQVWLPARQEANLASGGFAVRQHHFMILLNLGVAFCLQKSEAFKVPDTGTEQIWALCPLGSTERAQASLMLFAAVLCD